MDAPLLNVNVKTYLRFPLTLLKLFESLEPTVVIAVIAATAISEATVTDGDTIKLDGATYRGRLGSASGGWT